MSDDFVEEERELAYFHFTSSEICHDFREETEKTIFSTLNVLQTMLEDKLPGKEEEIRTQINELMKLFIEKAKEPLQRFEETVKDIFKLPPNIILPGFVNKEELISAEDFEKLEKEAKDLEKEYIKQLYRKNCLKKELEKLEHIQPLFEKIKKKLDFYKDNKPKEGEKSIEELYDALKSSAEFYFSKQSKGETDDVVDEYNMFQVL